MLFLKIYYHITADIKKIFYKIIYGKKVKFGKGVTFRKGFSLIIEKGATVEVGAGCFFNNYCSINAMEQIIIDENCLFGEGVKIYDHNHVFKNKDVPIKKQGFKCEKVKIEKNCWIGSNTIILKGVNVGEHSVIAAGEIVRRDVSSKSIFQNEMCSKIN